jgi:gp6-like head-tail connector protein
VPFTPTNPLCSLSDVKAALRISDTTDDDRLSLAIDAASRQIENLVERRFWQDATPSARVYVAMTPFLVEVDDFMTTTGLVVESMPYGVSGGSVIWDAANYQLEPLNGIFMSQAWPYTKIRAVQSLTFPVYGGIAYPQPFVQALVRVTARWGWNYIPTAVQKAAIIQAIALFKADDTPFGATPFGETGIVRLRQALHPTAMALLEPYVETGVPVA